MAGYVRNLITASSLVLGCASFALPATAQKILRHGCRAAGIGLVLAAAFATAARAEKPGCAYKDIDIAKYGEKPFRNPPQIVAKDGVLQTRSWPL